MILMMHQDVWMYLFASKIALLSYTCTGLLSVRLIISWEGPPQCKFRMVTCQVLCTELSLWRPGSGVGLEGCQILQPGVQVAPAFLEKGSEGKTDFTHLTEKQQDKKLKGDLWGPTILLLPECLFL